MLANRRNIAIAQAMCYNGYKLNERSWNVKIKVKYIESEEALFRDVRVPYIKLVAIHKSCPF